MFFFLYSLPFRIDDQYILIIAHRNKSEFYISEFGRKEWIKQFIKKKVRKMKKYK